MGFSMTDFHAISNSGVVHILSTHKEAADDTPLQMISRARLAQLLQIEQAAHQLAAALPLSPIAHEPLNPG